MQNLWNKFRWLLTQLPWLIAGLVLLINPQHIDQIIANHPQWSGVILALWTALLSWAQKTHPEQGTVYPPGTGANPVQAKKS